MNLILFGFKGCGKTHFGNLLAKKMGLRFIDTDDLLSKRCTQTRQLPQTPREIYAQIGAVAFRAFEKEAVASLKNATRAIIALGGGAVIDPENVALLQTIGCLAYLFTTPDILQKRILKTSVPAFLNEQNPEASFFEIFQKRSSIYESIPATKVDCSALDEAGVVSALQSLLIL